MTWCDDVLINGLTIPKYLAEVVNIYSNKNFFKVFLPKQRQNNAKPLKELKDAEKTYWEKTEKLLDLE